MSANSITKKRGNNSYFFAKNILTPKYQNDMF